MIRRIVEADGRRHPVSWSRTWVVSSMALISSAGLILAADRDRKRRAGRRRCRRPCLGRYGSDRRAPDRSLWDIHKLLDQGMEGKNRKKSAWPSGLHVN